MHIGAATRHQGGANRRLLIALMAFGLVAAACGGEETSDDVAIAEPNSTDKAATSTNADESSTDSNAGETDVTVASDDGILEVLVPAGSGPTDITFERIDFPDSMVPAVGYELGPDGATFSEPVTLTFALPAEEWSPGEGVPLVVFGSDRDDVPTVATTRDGDTVTVVAKVSHFTEFYVFGSNRIVQLEPIRFVAPKGGGGSRRGDGQRRRQDRYRRSKRTMVGSKRVHGATRSHRKR